MGRWTGGTQQAALGNKSQTKTSKIIKHTLPEHPNFNLWQVSDQVLWILCPEKGTQVMETQDLTVRYHREAPLSLLIRNRLSLENNSLHLRTSKGATMLRTSSPPSSS